jgi:hypothetical protein
MNENLTWRELTIIRILLFIAKLMAQNAEVKQELQQLQNHIAYGARQTAPVGS